MSFNSQQNPASKNASGFSLIEMGLAFAVVAVIAGGVMVGKNLYEGAQVNAVERNIKEYSQAADKFKELYGAYPGDFSGASSYFGCSSCDGNGNGMVEADADTNGDGTGDGVDETKLFWQQLSYAKLLKGKTETISSFIYPAGPFDGTIYRVSHNESRGMMFELTGYQGTTVGYAAMKPAYVMKLDSKYDDGNPTTGVIQASNGSGVTTCVSGTTYTATTDYAACVVNLSMQREGVAANDNTDLAINIEDCDSSNIGETRPSSTTCPSGYTGYILESCGRTGWRVTSRSCEPISCGGGFYRDKRTIACPPGYSGVITQTCEVGGGWVNDDPSIDTCDVGGTCNAGDSMTTQCPYGNKGQKVLRCDEGTLTWVEDSSSTCTLITCTSGGTTKSLGESFEDVTACPSGFTGSVLKTCTSDESFVPTNNTCRLIQNDSCGSEGDTRSLTCPTGMQGAVSQECRTASGGGTIWVTTQYTCSPVMCGDKPVGYIRQSSAPCTSGQTGYKEEVCQTSGRWLTTLNTCATNTCPGELAPTSYNATFDDTDASSDSDPLETQCNVGYTANPTVPVLHCNDDGTWGNYVSGDCSGGGMTGCFGNPDMWSGLVAPGLEPTSAAFSPDENYVYLTSGYCWGPNISTGAGICPFYRYDRSKAPSDVTAWEYLLPTYQVRAGNAPADDDFGVHGWYASASDSRYIYLAYGWNQYDRYDTTQSWTTNAAWTHIEGLADVSTPNKMQMIGTKLYLFEEGCTMSVYDTAQSFTSAAAWSNYDMTAALSTAGFDCATGDFGTPVYDGSRYVYFPPMHNSANTTNKYGKAVRYDTTKLPTNSTSFAVFDATSGLGSNYANFPATGYDGRYVYFMSWYEYDSQGYEGGTGVNLMRYDSTMSFTDIAAWQGVNLGTLLGVSSIFPDTITYDGKYMIFSFVSVDSDIDDASWMLAYDPTKTFNSAASWKRFDIKDMTGGPFEFYVHTGSSSQDYTRMYGNHTFAEYAQITDGNGITYFAAWDYFIKYDGNSSCTSCSAMTSATFNADFPETEAYGYGYGTCSAGYSNDPTAPVLYCQSDGTWASNLTSGNCWNGSDPVNYVAITNIWDGSYTGGGIYTSMDGLSWQNRTSPFGTSFLTDVATDGLGNWVVVSTGGKLATSTDARTWTLQTSSFGTTDILGVAHNGQSGNNGLWIAVGASGKAAKSAASLTAWKSVGTGTAYNYKYIAHNGLSGNLGRFMFTDGSSRYATIADNNANITTMTQPGYGGTDGAMITNNRSTTNNMWMVVGVNQNTIYTSTNYGASWTNQGSAANGGWGLATDGAGLWIKGANGADVMRASDGALGTWTSTNEQMPGDVNVLQHNRLPSGSGGLWMAGADNGTYSTSSDGISWTYRGFPVENTADNEFLWKIAAAKASSCASATLALDSGATITGTFAQTADSTTYTASCPSGYGGNAVRRCTNGTWGSLISECVQQIHYVAVTSGGSSGGQIYTSGDDGVTWTARTSPFGSDGINDVAYDGIGTWVAVGANGKLATSFDGINWTLRTSSFGTTAIRSVAHNGQSGSKSMWVIVGNSNKTAYSVDGITWTQLSGKHSGKNLYYVTHNGLSGTPGYFMYKQEQDGGTAKNWDGKAWTATTTVGWSGVEKLANNRDTTTNTWLTTGTGVKKSTDLGATWTTVYAAPLLITGLAYDGTSRWVGGSNCSQGGTSTNLTAWVASDLKGTGGYSCAAGATGDATKVIIHNKLPSGAGGLWLSGGAGCNAFPSGGCTTTKLTTSTDGVSWTRRSFPSVDQAGEIINGIASAKAASCAETTLAADVAGGKSVTFAQTADSTTYTASCPSGYTGSAVRRCSNGTWGALVSACAKDTWIAVGKLEGSASGTPGRVARSVDAGATWTAFDMPGSVEDLNRIWYESSEDRWYALGDDQEFWYSTTDGSSWTKITGTGMAGGHNLMMMANNGLSGGSKLWMLVSEDGDVSTSPTGIDSWTVKTALGANVTNDGTKGHVFYCAHATPKWVVVGENNLVKYSTDNGATWNNATVPAGTEHNSYGMWANNAGVITGDDRVFYSSDCVTWSVATITGGSTKNFKDMIYNSSANMFVATSNSSTVIRSTDGGATWTKSTITGTSPDISGLAYNGKTGGSALYMAISRDNPPVIYTSTDAITWTTVTSTGWNALDSMYDLRMKPAP